MRKKDIQWTGPVESVDLRLDELLDELSDYHSRLNAQLSKRYKEFEHQSFIGRCFIVGNMTRLKSIPPSLH